MDELIKTLRGDLPETKIEKHWVLDWGAITDNNHEAADVIETLQARVEVLERALRPFALAAEKGSNVYVGVKQAMADYPQLFSYSTAYIDAGRSVAHSCLTWNDYREARAALQEKSK